MSKNLRILAVPLVIILVSWVRSRTSARTAAKHRDLAGIQAMMSGGTIASNPAWAQQGMEVYSSDPFNPRQFTGSDTEFLHLKNATEQDADGETTFPPTGSPIELYQGWFKPTASPSDSPTLAPVTLSPLPYGVTRAPTRAPSKMPSGRPTREPSKFPTREPTRDPSKGPTRQPLKSPTRDPSRNPTRDPSRNPTRDPSRHPTRDPSKGPSRMPTREPSKMPTRNPSKMPTREPSKMPTRDPSRMPTRDPSKMPTRDPSRMPTRDPTRNPTRDPSGRPTRMPTRNQSNFPTRMPTRRPVSNTQPNVEPQKDDTSIVDYKEQVDDNSETGIVNDNTSTNTGGTTDNNNNNGGSNTNTGNNNGGSNTGSNNDGGSTDNAIVAEDSTSPVEETSFYCGTSVSDAMKCRQPCPNGIKDCTEGFCYAVSSCSMVVQSEPVPDTNNAPPPTNRPSAAIVPKYTPSPQKAETAKPSALPSSSTANVPTPEDIFYCGESLDQLSCLDPCPTGSPVDCPNGLKCFASTDCAGGSPTNRPVDPTGTFYCGSSFENASTLCSKACPSGTSSECPPDQACFANTPCEDKGSFFCGTSIINASAMCETSCPNGLDSECPSGLACYETVTCGPDEPTRAPTVPDVEDGTKYCGYTYEHASNECTQPCPTGQNDSCPDGMSCYAHTPCEERGTFYCGNSWNNAASSCQFACPSGTDEECPGSTKCYAYTTCDEVGSFACGTSFEEASADCDHPCPSGSPTECPSGSFCFTHTMCSFEAESEPTPEETTPYIPGDSFFCGTSFLDASTRCTDACPSRLDVECPNGEKCFGSTPCPTRETYYCGANLQEASAICQYPCPTGDSDDCPTGLSCFAFTSCADQGSFYCGSNFLDADASCELPCPTGLSDECPDDLTCFSYTTCADVEPPAETPVGSNFCGASFDEATRECSLPCPSGLDSECPLGTTCHPHTSCNDRDSFMCGNSWDHAASTCSNPCPSGEHSDCPPGMSCFAYTPCNNAGSFYCGTSFDEASSCDTPCPSGHSTECPDGLSCFSYTSCGTGDFNPVEVPELEDFTLPDSYFCGSSFDDASESCKYQCPGGSIDCPTGLACFERTSCVGKDVPVVSEQDSFYCGKNLADANEKCLVPCPEGTSSVCPIDESCIPFTSCENPNAVDQTELIELVSTFFCGTDELDARSCSEPCPNGPTDCPAGTSCFSFTTCDADDPKFNTVEVPELEDFALSDSYFCGSSFDDASESCSVPCPGGSVDCPTGLACFERTSCVGKDVPVVSEQDSFYCGKNLADANEKCLVPCPEGTSSVCPVDESCIPFTSCENPNAVDQTELIELVSTFFCGTDELDARSCSEPCPNGPTDCPVGTSCFSFTTCDADDSPPESTPADSTPSTDGSFYCGSSFEDATLSCSVPCPGGSSSECPNGMSCYGFTSCKDRSSFFCGTTWDEAAETCSKPCPSGNNDECDGGDVCFGYTPCSLADTDIPVDSFYCGASFADAVVSCTDPCPSGEHSDCPDGQLCHPYTPCSERESSFCGYSWTDAATSCLVPCQSGSSAECPTGQSCFPSTPCAEVESFFCGSIFDDANTSCEIPCRSGQSGDCPNGMGCFAYTLCNERGDEAVVTPTLAPIPDAPPESYYCGTSFDDASTACADACPSGESEECPDGLYCFSSTPCSDTGSFFCGVTWEIAAASCTEPCPSGLSSDCPSGEQCFGYTPCTKSESFYCGTTFEDASTECAVACPSGSDSECPDTTSCFKYTPCADKSDVPDDSNQPLEDEDTYYCGLNFADAADRCYLPCPSGSAAECPVGEACYGNTPCSGGDSFFCGLTWYDASSECKVPCPSGSDAECPDGAKCFGYTPCSEVDSFYCGSDFVDASTFCLKPCPSGSSQECPLGLSCYPNTPCGYDAGVATPKPSSSPVKPVVTKAPTKTPTVFPTPPLSFETAGKTTMAPSIPSLSSFYCGTDVDEVNCLLPCQGDEECPLDHNCFATQVCSDSFYCGVDFQDANSTCSQACPDGKDESCPMGTSCYANTLCDELTPDFVAHPGTYYCGRNYTDASESCALACPGGSSQECSELGPEFACYASTPCDDKDTYYCGTSWSHAAANCLFPCPTGNDSQCPDGTSCYPYTTCDQSFSFMCGTSFEDASSCERPCPSGSSSECPFGESCFTHTTCSAETDDVPDTPAYVPGDSYFCGTTYFEAATVCLDPCPSRSDAECPDGQQCYGNTPCPARDTYFCGKSLDEASGDCDYPCPNGDECPDDLSCFAFTTCEDKKSYFCGTSYIDASLSCGIPCESGMSADCPDEMACFAFTTCEGVGQTTDSIASGYCGASFDEASQTCAVACNSTADCPIDEACFHFSTCDNPTDLEDIPVASFYCGTTFEEASMKCTEPCPSGSHSECSGNQFCFPNTPCEGLSSSFCGYSWNDASTSCEIPCPSGSSGECPSGQTCYPSTPCDQNNTFFCGKSFDDATHSCALPCPTGKSTECPEDLGCFAYTVCGKDGSVAVETPPLPSFEAVPSDSYYCGADFDDASKRCDIPCPSGMSTECPNNLACYAGTSCASSNTFFCGKTWEDASTTCAFPCSDGSDSQCPIGEKCFGFTPCSHSDTFYCGSSFDDASLSCSVQCPSGLDSECPGADTCFKYTSCGSEFEGDVPDADGPDGSYFCGRDFEDASTKCTVPCPSKSSVECPVGDACFAYTTCNVDEIIPNFAGETDGEVPSFAPDGSFFCGLSFEDASTQCATPCPGGSSCPDGLECHAYTTCLGTESESYFCGVDFDSANSTCSVSCPDGKSDVCPLGQACFAYTSCAAEDEIPVYSASKPIPSIPLESYYCGLDYEEASTQCAIPCPNMDSATCPGFEQCFAFTPCERPESFFCGMDFDNANDSCAIPCPTGRSDSCPNGESCFAYTTCDMRANNAVVYPPPTQSPVMSPVLKDDFFVVPPNENTFVDSLSNDVPAPGADPLRVTEILPPPESNAPSMSSSPSESPSQEDVRRRLGESIENDGSARLLQGGIREDDGAPSSKGGVCYPSGDQMLVRYTPPADFVGRDTCIYKARDINGLEDTAVITFLVQAYPTRKPTPRPSANPTPEPTKFPTKYPTRPPTPKPSPAPSSRPTKIPTAKPTAKPTPRPTDNPTRYPTNKPSAKPTKYPTRVPTSEPTLKPIIPVTFDVPMDSFYCGVTFDHASLTCGKACPNGNSDCPQGLTCFGNTPCGDKHSFFCGLSFEDANTRCTSPCETGSADECPNGQSCFAYTMCKPITDKPTNYPTAEPTPEPSERPTKFPTRRPTPYPSGEPTKEPTDWPTRRPTTDRPTAEPTDYPTKKPTSEPTAGEPPKTNEDVIPNLAESTNPDVDEPEPESPSKEIESNPKPSESVEKVEDQPKPPPEEEEEDQPKPPPEEEEEDQPKPPPEDPEVEDRPNEVIEQNDALVIELKPCDDPLAMTVNQAYWRSWSSDRPETCNRFEASDIEVSSYTHVVYSFASISADGHLEPWVGSWDEVDKYEEFNKIKQFSPTVKTVIAATEGVFYGAGMNPVTFSEVAETSESRMIFAQSVVSFLKLYNFDGLEIDWKSPLNPDKGGRPENYDRFVKLVKEIRSALDSSGEDYTLTVALPGQSWELFDYDIEGLVQHVDWFNLMSFDYHTPKNVPKTVGAHTDLKLIDSVVYDLVQQNKPTKFVLGMAAYGRTYTLADSRCQEIGCPFRSPGLGGCGNTPGFLPFNEISAFVQSGAMSYQDVSSSSMVAAVNEDQLISYDDETTWSIKTAYAEMMCLRGTHLWSIDMLTPPSDSSNKRRRVEAVPSSTSSEPTCDICQGTKLYSGVSVLQDNSELSCAEINTLALDSTLDCATATQQFGGLCCADKPTTPCNICEANSALDEGKYVHFQGEAKTCGEIHDTYFNLVDEHSFSCSVSKAMVAAECCQAKCMMCGTGELDIGKSIELDGEVVSCTNLEAQIFEQGVVEGSTQCSDMSNELSSCCTGNEEVAQVKQASELPCNICSSGGGHLELNSEALVEFRGLSVSCLEVNSILAKSETLGNEVCDTFQASLLDECCYQGCSLCGAKELSWNEIVTYNGEVLSCSELHSLFSMSSVQKDSVLCQDMEMAYADRCCFEAPSTPCNMCGSDMELNMDAFIKDSSVPVSCHDYSLKLNERVDAGDDTCTDAIGKHSATCCIGGDDSSKDTTATYYDWLVSHIDIAADEKSGGWMKSIPLVMLVALASFVWILI